MPDNLSIHERITLLQSTVLRLRETAAHAWRMGDHAAREYWQARAHEATERLLALRRQEDAAVTAALQAVPDA